MNTTTHLERPGVRDSDERLDASTEPAEREFEPEEDAPARRLLAHHLEFPYWDIDGEGNVPPPD
jgi:hypothetical protein